MKWYELDNNKRIKEVYGSFTIQEFWEWWSDKENVWMEVRIKDVDLIKEVANKFNLPWSYSGVYVNSHIKLKNVIAITRDKAKMWFGINPRKKNWNNWGTKSFGSGAKGGSSDENVEVIKFIFVDIDRVIKDGEATKEDLKNADILADKLIKCLEAENWNNSYIKICSGNGLQLLIKLDFPIKMPDVTYDSKNKMFMHSGEFLMLQKIISKGIGNQMYKLSKKYKIELGVDVDKTGFTIGRVGALPFTKNFKHEGFTWRGLVELKKGKNDGLTDYIMELESDVYRANAKNIFGKSKALTLSNRLRPGYLLEHELVKFMLSFKFPEGGINNTLWFQLKCLIRDSNIDVNSKEFKLLHNDLRKLHDRSFTLNLPDKKFTFDENIVNKYCINIMMPPLYDVWPHRTNKLDACLENFTWGHKDFKLYKDSFMELDEDDDILQDFNKAQKKLVPGSYNINEEIAVSFIKGLIKKYGEEKAKYYFDYLFVKGMCFK